MVFLPEIIALINTALSTRLSKYPKAEFSGLTTTAIRFDQDNKQVAFPSIIALGGKQVDAINFSVNPAFIVYHRALSTNFTPSTQTKSYGDGDVVNSTASTTIRLVCAGNRKDIEVFPEELAMIIADALPAKPSPKTRIKDLTVSVNTIFYDARTVFNTEFQGIPFNIVPDRFLFSIQYTIQGSYLSGCLKSCDC